ncbi:MAG: type I phosphomannose isomerase catalytic subunit [Candidatus Cyclobacteriaceae bacterium M3_2C_046]
MKTLYPLKFKTIFKDKIWGGKKIKKILGKDFAPLPNCGETWELSGVKGNVSVVENGPLQGKSLVDLINRFQKELVGEHVYQRFGCEFPLLVKFIDANDDLSIQVHPHDQLAKARHNSFGKTEMWYIIQADQDASLITGFNQPVDRETYLEKFKSGKLTDILNREKVDAEDMFFIPAGRVHTIGKGILLAEIQQTSDVTYRIYDFDRVDHQGNPRELHVEEALDAIDYNFYDQYKTQYQDGMNQPVQLASCPYFITNKLHYDQEAIRSYQDIDSFVIYVCLQGSFTIQYGTEQVHMKMGEVVLLPASIKEVILKPQDSFKVLESYVPEI